jgi:hypothetical protein
LSEANARQAFEEGAPLTVLTVLTVLKLQVVTVSEWLYSSSSKAPARMT